ncbi:MAG: hypothetical protein O9262_14200 [Cyclobacteriaceae bacterium]|nr:hypothetical protein [Cyclobacteriaceae bacterium]
MTRTKHILFGAGAVAALYGASYVLKLNRLSNELESVTKASIYKVSLDGIELRIDVTLKNPSGGSVKVKHPFVKMIYGDVTVASSQIKDVNISIPKYSEVNMEPVMVSIGFMSLATTVPGLLKEYRNTGKLSMTVKTITTINDSLPYTKTDTITLGGGKEA